MKAPRMTKVLSFLMALVFCLYLVPTEALAVEVKKNALEAASEYARDYDPVDSPDIVSEIASSRDEYQKEYMLSNGQHLLTVYPTAVHYADENGEWQEIDNTLHATSMDGKRVYRNTAGLWDVTLPSSLSGADPVTVARGDSALSFRFAGQLLQDDVLTAKLARMNEDIAASESGNNTSEPEVSAEPEPADTLADTSEPQSDANSGASEEASSADENTANPTESHIAVTPPDTTAGASSPESENNAQPEAPSPGEDTANESPVSGTADDADESAAPVTKNDTIDVIAESQWETATTTKMGDTVFGRTQVQPSQLTLKDSEIIFSQNDKTLQETFSEKLSSTAEYTAVFNGVNVRYDLNSNSLKESVIIAAAPTGRTGYQYLLETKNLVLELQEDNSIYAYAIGHTEGDEPVFFMPAPYLFDQDKAYCDDIELILKETDEGYLLTYLLPQEWMADEDRAYPVVLDPVVHAELSFTNIADQTVFSITQLSHTWSMLCIGQGSYGIGRSFVKYKNLPALTSADVIVDAKMALYKIQTSSSTSEIDVHSVYDTWESNTINWSNKPDYDPIVEDYQIAGAQGWYYWDVTDIAQGWYAGENTGMMFKMEDSQEAAARGLYREFCSSDYSAGTLPYLSIAYINNCGLESIWDYTSHSAGAAGTGYINDYTGNLVWVYNGLGFSGNRMPVAINHVYNANDKANNDFGMGYGWRSNYNQLVYQWSTDSSYYVWEDEDATRHYFKYKSSGTYEDETNPTLTLTTTGSGTTKYCITDKNGNKSYFDTNGRLTKINNNQAAVSSITITYSSGKQIASITDGAGRKYQFNYSGAMLSSISFLGTGTSSLATESYTYSGNELTGISSTLLSSASFSYTSNHLLSQAEDAGGYRLAYLYNTTSSTKPNRVIQISEHDGNTDGDVLCIYYAHKQTIFTDSNNNQEVKQFNNYGSTVSIQDGQGKAQFYKYKSNNDVTKASQLALSSKLQNTVANWVRNSSFEQTGFWTAGSGNASTGSWSYTSTGYIGSKSLAISRTSSSGTIRVDSTQAAYCPANSSYTLSAYVKTTGMSGGGLGAQLVLMSSGNVIASSAPITANTDWTRVEVTYTNTTGSDISDLTAGMRNGTSGTAYFDCVQLEASANASRYNLVDNGDFSYNSSLGWNKNSACTSADGSSSNYYRAPALNDSCLKLVGAAEKDKQVSQTIAVSGSEGDVFSVAGWALGDSAPIANDGNRRFAISARFNYTNGTSDATLIAFNPNAIGFVNWQYVADRIVAKKAYKSITISLLYSYNVNEVYFDGIQLFKEEFGHSYVYDSNGNVTSVTDLQKKTTTYEYSSNNLTKMTLPSGASQTYTYDNYHNVLSATSPEGVVSNFTYDSYGNNTKVTVGSGTKKVTSSATYTSNGDQLATVTDALGQVTAYGYDTQTGILNWTQAPGETTATRTNYSHDSRYRTTSVAKGNSTVNYTYNSDLLSAISSASGTDYTFIYGAFDLVNSVKIGSRALISHTYSDDSSHWLTRSDYGNGDYITYSYDRYGRTSAIGYEDNAEAVKYTYDNNGNLGILTDNISGRKTKYLYDFQDRLMGYEERSVDHSNTVKWGYDDKNNLSSQTQTLNGTSYTTNYSYDNDNRLKQATTGGKSANYTYDVYSRMTGIAAKNGSSTVVSTGITYKDPTSATTSTQVYKWATGGTTYTYTYDARGNITAISDGTNTTSYVYDSLDQLTRENNQAAGKTWVYTYDNGGNILSKSEYAYTTGALGTALDTISYGYGDSEWRDLLTSYDGKRLTADEIGNLRNDGKWSYTWRRGRILWDMSRMVDEDAELFEAVQYRYDSNGRRIGKTYGDSYNFRIAGGQLYYIGDSTGTSYYYAGDDLSQINITFPDNSSTSLHFTYDEIGPMSVTYDGAEYFYLKNAQGDVTGLVNSSGTQVVAYTYDAWGNPLTTTGAMADTLGKLNPFRYRGYVYDTETGLYYLGSRYYNPETGRFINADSINLITATPNSATWDKNLFSYCDNNPVVRKDHGGELWSTIIGMTAGAVIGVAGQIVSDLATSVLNGKLSFSNWQTYAGAILGGAIGGAVLGSTGNVNLANAVAGATTTGIGMSLEKLTGCSDKSWAEIGANAVVDGAISYGLGKLPGVKNITAGKNNMSAVYKSGLTKLRNKTVSNISKKVYKKGVISGFVGGLAMDGYYGVKQFAYPIARNRVLNHRR